MEMFGRCGSYGAKTGEAFLAYVSLNRVNPFNYYIETDVEFLVVKQKRIFNVPLDQELMGKRVFRQILELLDERDALASAAFGRLGDEALIGKVPHVQLQVVDFVGQQEGVGHKAVLIGEKTLQAANDDAENILLCKMLF